MNEDKEVEVVFLKKNDNCYSNDQQLHNFYHQVMQLQLYDIKNTHRKGQYLDKSANTMYCIGCSKQWREQYTGSNIPQLKKIQPVIDYLNLNFEKIEATLKQQGLKMKIPAENYSICENCTDHTLDLKRFKRGSFTYDYFAQAHIDRGDRTYTIFVVLWLYRGMGGYFFHSGVQKFFLMAKKFMEQ